MKINRICEALGSLSEKTNLEAIEDFETAFDNNNGEFQAEQPRVVKTPRTRKAPVLIAAAGICAAAVAIPLCLKNFGGNAELNSLRAADGKTASVVSTDKGITASTVKLRLSLKDGELTAVPDEENPNVIFVTVSVDKTKSDKYGLILNPDGSFEACEGEEVTDEKFKRNNDKDEFGLVWVYDEPNNDGTVCHLDPSDSVTVGVGSSFENEKDRLTDTFCYSLNEDMSNYVLELASRYIEITDNGDGTYSAEAVDQGLYPAGSELREEFIGRKYLYFDFSDEETDKSIASMESPDFQETIERMRQLGSDEIDDMYEQFKNEMEDEGTMFTSSPAQ